MSVPIVSASRKPQLGPSLFVRKPWQSLAQQRIRTGYQTIFGFVSRSHYGVPVDVTPAGSPVTAISSGIFKFREFLNPVIDALGHRVLS